MDVKLAPYKKTFNYSYSIGVYPTLELLTHQAGRVIKVVLSSKGEQNKGLQKIKELCKLNKIEIEVGDGLVNKLSNSENAYAVGVFHKYSSDLDQRANHLVLVSPSDTGNLGTIARTMLGFGVHNLALIRPAVDIFDPKVIRASMGAIFQLRYSYFDSFGEYATKYKRPYYAFMTTGAKNLLEVNFAQPHSLIFGNEGSGLSDEFSKLGIAVKIPQTTVIDSLNLSVAVGIGLYVTGSSGRGARG